MSELPTILAIDTTLEACSAALLIHGQKVTASEPMARGQTERLVPMIQELCAASNVALGDLDALAVTLGPGSFTGVRVGLATAQGMAFALSVPLYGYSTLEVISKVSDERPLTVAIDTKRGEVFTQNFDNAENYNDPKIVTKQAFSEDTFTSLISNVEDFKGQKLTAKDILDVLLDSALRDFKSGEIVSINDLEPIYLRDAEISKSKINYRKIKA